MKIKHSDWQKPSTVEGALELVPRKWRKQRNLLFDALEYVRGVRKDMTTRQEITRFRHELSEAHNTNKVLSL